MSSINFNPGNQNFRTTPAAKREQSSSTLDGLVKLLFDLQHNTKNPDQSAIAKILKQIQLFSSGDNLA